MAYLFLKILNSISNIVDRFVRHLTGIFMAILTSIMIISVFFRFLLHLPLAWSEEISRTLLVWVIFLAGSSALNKGMHLSLTFIIERFPEKIRRILSILTSGLVLFFLFIAIKEGIISSYFEWHQSTYYLEIPITFSYAAVPAGLLIMSLHIICFVLNSIISLPQKHKSKYINEYNDDYR